MISLRQRTERRSGGTNRLPQQLGSIMLGALLGIVGILSMNSICLAQGDTWATKRDMPTARYALSTSVVDGKIYAIGGANGSNQPALSAVEAYDPTTDTWTTKADMPTERFLLSSSVVDGIIYAIGGSPFDITGTTQAVSTVEAYDPGTDSWTSKANMATERWSLSTCAVNGKIYVIGGGRTSPFKVFGELEIYDPATDTWTRKAHMLTPRWGVATCVIDGIIYAIGGQQSGGSWSSIVEAYDPTTDTWTRKTNMPTGRTHFSASAVNGITYAIGGGTNPGISLPVVEAYDPATDAWTSKTDMPTGRFLLSTSALNGKVYAIGGARAWPAIPLSTVEEYAPLTTSVEDYGNNTPSSFVLHQNHPNPFNPETRISYEVSKPALVVLQVINVLGQKVRTLVDEVKPAGFYEVLWDGRDNAGRRMPSGVYLYRIEGRGLVMTRKMVLVE